MNDKPIEEIIQYIDERWDELNDWLEKKIWEAELDLGYEAVKDEADRRGVPESEIWKEIMEFEETEIE